MGIKHTPGPWVIRRAQNGQTILEVGPIFAYEYEGCSWLNVEEEDARLIAAAPELLEALEELANGYEGNGWDVGLVPRIKKARAAIAKAKGEEQ